MPTSGMLLQQGQTIAPVSSALAIDEIPQRKLYVQNNGQPVGQMNSPALNSSANFDFGSQASGASNQMDNLAQTVSTVASLVQNEGQVTQQQVQQANQQTQSAFSNTNNKVDAVGGSVSDFREHFDEVQLENSVLFGFQEIVNAEQGIWNYNSSNTFFTPTEDLLVNAAAGASIVMSQQLLRLQSSVHFYVWYVFAEQSGGFYDVEWLNDASPNNKPRDQTPLAYLQSVYPQYPWEDNHDGTGLTGMSWPSSVDGIPRSYYWSPECPSLDDIFHLWDYQPTSGGPTRNGITDFISIISLLPVQF